MRLTPDEKKVICSVVRSFCHDKATLYLYGSRVDDTKRGGDIDLLLIVETTEAEEKIGMSLHKILAKMKEAIGDQQIDFSVITKEKATASPFFEMVLKHASILEKWHT